MADEGFEAILRSLVEIALKQDRINADFRAFGAEVRTAIADVRTAIVEIKTTQQQIAALLQRLVNPSGNGAGEQP
jgi:hypothetical protein